jgi:hypothetical protein
MVMLLLAQPPATLTGTAIDPQGPMIEAEVVLAQGPAPDGSVPILARATTDSEGRFSIAAPDPGWRPGRDVWPCLFSYRAGSGLVASVAALRQDRSSPIGLNVDAAGRRTITLRGVDGRPMAGVRLAPLAVRPVESNYAPVAIPEVLVERMEVTTGPDGRAVLACLSPGTNLISIRVAIPGQGTQALVLRESDFTSGSVTLDLKPAGRIAGNVVLADGRPAAGAAVEVWSLAGRYGRPAPVRFDSGPIRTGADGRFLMPPGLLAGVKYRALVRADGSRPVLTEWATPPDRPDGTVDLADVALTPQRALAGRVVDRRGQPVAGAEVIAGGEGVSTATDERGAFRLDGLDAGRSFLVVRRDGFRIDGRLVGAGENEIEFVPARFDEPARRPMTTLPGPLPLDERRRLARRVLEPFRVKVLARGEDSPKAWAIRSLMVFDPQAAIEALGRTTFQQPGDYLSFLKCEISGRLARDDVAAAVILAETIAEPHWRANALVEICAGLPADQADRKRQLIDRALAAARAEPLAKRKVWYLGEVAGLLLDLGEAERARAVFAEGLALARKLGPDGSDAIAVFASRLGQVDLAAALELIGHDDGEDDYALAIGNLAARIAATQPAEAERLIGTIRGRRRGLGAVFRACQNMAPADLSRARRIATALDDAGMRSAALIFAAYGLPASERTAPRDLIIRQALRGFDRSSGPADRGRWLLPALMPLAEAMDPALVPEFFWRTIADLGVANDPRSEYGRYDVLGQAILLARYDRAVAAALLEPAAKASPARGHDAGEMTPSEVILLGVIDPRRAAAAVEAMPEPTDLGTDGANWSRIILSEAIGDDDTGRWKRIWSIFSGLGGVLGRRDVLF